MRRPARPPTGWLEGFAAGQAEGLAAGRAEADTRSDRLSADLAGKLQDMTFNYAEARGQVLASLRPLFELLIDRLLPAIAAQAVAPWLVQALLDAARADSATPLVIHLHPERLGAVRACLPPGLPAQLRPDPALGLQAARLTSREGESDLDLDACLLALREALSTLLDATSGKVRHG
ncbi:hypothetical protein [Rubellimicrobium roseum]|uniref:Flagellar biosynthesis protein n=1 Tax=Rubellimicrobium roseum TaxID=687525 RepID=A0A5C4NFB5_9RHOB|nr:hypothetical protein [Rubellimicrobium roseum]TNC71307.1 hypothetical protein FHG71_11975 [Rubellimicrobium roseum]